MTSMSKRELSEAWPGDPRVGRPGSSPSEGEALRAGRRGRGPWQREAHARRVGSAWRQDQWKDTAAGCPLVGTVFPGEVTSPQDALGTSSIPPVPSPEFHRHPPFMAPLSQPTLTPAGPACPRPCWTRSGRGKVSSERHVLSCPGAQSSTH